MFRIPTKNSAPGFKKLIPNMEKVKPEFCQFPYRVCHHPCLEDYDYCLKHILEDKMAPYKTCSYVYSINGRKCNQPAPKDRKDSRYCAEHALKTERLRHKASSQHLPPQTPESLLASLSHYVPPAHNGVMSTNDEVDVETTDASSPTHTVNPFTEVDASKVNSSGNKVLDYASESDSDVEPTMIDSVWHGQDQDSSDGESIDSQLEDPLKHAGVYTAEEAVLLTRDKLVRLQTLYIEQYRRLQYVLRDRRRKYLLALKKEKETLSSIHAQSRTSAKELKLYEKLKALNRYQKFNGIDAIMHRKSFERRAQVTEGMMIRNINKGKCIFTEGGVKCGAKAIPVTKYCRKHILEDPQQVLYRACGCQKADHVCQEPTLNIFENATCVYHVPLPSLQHASAKESTNTSSQMKEELKGNKVEVKQRTVVTKADGEEVENKETRPAQNVVPMETEDDATAVVSTSKSNDNNRAPSGNNKTEASKQGGDGNTNSGSELVMDDLGVDVVEEVLEADDGDCGGNSNKCDSTNTDCVKQDESTKENSKH